MSFKKLSKKLSVISMLLLGFISSVSMAVSHDSSYDSISEGAVKIIKRFEGFRSTIYDAGDGLRTIGYGHLVKGGEKISLSTDEEEILGLRPITEQEACHLLLFDIKTKANINPLVHTKRSQNELDALTSLCFNIGVTRFSKSTVLEKVNAGETEGAYEYFGHWRRANGEIMRGLVKRRFAELFIFADKTLDPESSIVPSEQWGMAPMEITDGNWGRLTVSLREEAVKIYESYHS